MQRLPLQKHLHINSYLLFMKKAIPLLVILLTTQILFAQKITSKFRILDNTQKPVIGATLKLISNLDSTKISYATADTAGVATILVSAGQYQLRISSVGFKNISKGLTISEKQNNFRISMETDANALGGVTVVAKKPLMVQEDDKTIVDPQPLTDASTNSYEVMEKIPGVFLDQDGNVYLSSSTPATIFINGREQKMSASDIASMLKSLPPNSIEKIEIIRTPSAQYDANSTGGVVNIILKKGVKIGLTGSVYAGANQGKYGNRFAGFNLNNSNGSRTSYFNFNYNNSDYYERLETTRKFSIDSVLTQNALTRYPADRFYSGYGFNFELNKKWDLSFDGNASLGQTRNFSENENQIKRLSTETIYTQNLNEVNNKNNSFSFNQGVNAKYKIDSAGSDLIFDLSYTHSQTALDQDFTTSFQKPVRNPLNGIGDIETGRNNLAMRVDFKYKLPRKLTFESGLKSNVQNYDNITQYFTVINAAQSVDVRRTNTFNYKENINAAYIQASKTLGEFVIKSGLRIENTNMNGRQIVPKDTTFKINRTDFFPYIYLSRSIVKIAGFPLRGFIIYRRTITRPIYDYLNPTPRVIDQYLYEAGNPRLRPQFTQNIEANISMNEMPIFQVGRNYTQDIFTNVVYQDPRNPSVVYRTYDNLGKNEETYFRMIGANPPGGTYFGVLGVQYNMNKYTGQYENAPLTFTRGSWGIFTYQQVKIDKRSTFSLNGRLQVNGQQQFYELSNFGGVSANVNRTFLNRKLTVTLNVSDVFFTNRNDFELNQGSIKAEGRRVADTRRVGLNIRYNFGIRKREEGGVNPLDFNSLESGSR
jgi:iron complex outermembrane recepter protein